MLNYSFIAIVLLIAFGALLSMKAQAHVQATMQVPSNQTNSTLSTISTVSTVSITSINVTVSLSSTLSTTLSSSSTLSTFSTTSINPNNASKSTTSVIILNTTSASTSIPTSTTILPSNHTSYPNVTGISSLKALYGGYLLNGLKGTIRANQSLSQGQVTSIVSGLSRSGTPPTFAQVNVAYGTVMGNGRPVIAGSTLYYLSLMNGTTNVTVYTVQVVKAPPPLSLEVDGAMLSAQNSTVIIRPPVLPGKTTYQVSTSMFADLYPNNSAQFQYSVKIGNRMAANGTLNASSFSKSLSFTAPANVTSYVTFDTPGDANYSTDDPTANIIPANIQYYIPITLTNNQANVLAANSPVPLGALANGNIIGFNALSYQRYEANGLQNSEFFDGNGNILVSWLEGNMLNEYGNVLNTATNVTWWVLTRAQIPANGGTYNIYLGWAGNTLTATNTLFSNTLSGEAPQLSCTNPSNTQTGCGSNQYGEYDTGNLIFTGFYSNFSGSTLNTAKWAGYSNAGNTPKITVANSVSFVTTNSAGDQSAFESNVIIANAITMTFQMFGHLAPKTGTAASTAEGWGYQENALGQATNTPYYGVAVQPSNTVFRLIAQKNIYTSPALAGNWDYGNTVNSIYSVGLLYPANTVYLQYNYGATSSVSNTVNAIANTVVSGGFGVGFGVQQATNGISFVQWIRVFPTPPNDIYPQSSYGTIIANTICTISLSLSSINFGSLVPSTTYPTNLGITDNDLGSSNTFIYVSGGNWLLGTNFGFGMSNTLWDLTSDSTYKGNALTATATNTNIFVPSLSSNNIYFGLSVPSGQGAGTYNQIITIMNVC